MEDESDNVGSSKDEKQTSNTTDPQSQASPFLFPTLPVIPPAILEPAPLYRNNSSSARMPAIDVSQFQSIAYPTPMYVNARRPRTPISTSIPAAPTTRQNPPPPAPQPFNLPMPSASVEVVDLTGEERRGDSLATPIVIGSSPNATHLGTATRGPRYPNSIIDLSLETPVSTTNDVEYISTRRLNTVARPSPATAEEQPIGPLDLQFLGINLIPAEHQPGYAVIGRRFRQLLVERPPTPTFDEQVRYAGLATGFRPPTMDYMARAQFFPGYYDESDLEVNVSSPAEQYEPPEPAPDGFTRTPREGDVLVCPNCEEELCVGEEEKKKQAWVVRHCGHVYCGQCAVNRFKTKGRKAKGPVTTRAFSTCVVDGCQSRTSSPTAMVQLYF